MFCETVFNNLHFMSYDIIYKAQSVKKRTHVFLQSRLTLAWGKTFFPFTMVQKQIQLSCISVEVYY